MNVPKTCVACNSHFRAPPYRLYCSRLCKPVTTLARPTRAPRIPEPRETPEEVLWGKVRRLRNGCWVWTGGRFGQGPGGMYRRERLHARRIAWALVYGEVPERRVKSVCGLRECINPEHCWQEPTLEEVQAMAAKRIKRISDALSLQNT